MRKIFMSTVIVFFLAALVTVPAADKDMISGGLRFDGENDSIITEKNIIPPDTDAITVTMWVKGEESGGHQSGNLIAGTVILHFCKTLAFHLSAQDGTSSGYLNWDVPPIKEPLRQHIAVTWSSPSAGGDGKMKLYVNGISQTSSLFFAGGKNGKLKNGNLRFFARFNPGMDGFKGEVKDIRVYNRELSPSEILTIYAGKQPDADKGMILWYPLNAETEMNRENSKYILTDCSGRNNHGKVTGNPPWLPINEDWRTKAALDQIETTCALMEKLKIKCAEKRKILEAWMKENPAIADKYGSKLKEINRQFDIIEPDDICNPLDILRSYTDMETEIGLEKLFPSIKE